MSQSPAPGFREAKPWRTRGSQPAGPLDDAGVNRSRRFMPTSGRFYPGRVKLSGFFGLPVAGTRLSCGSGGSERRNRQAKESSELAVGGAGERSAFLTVAQMCSSLEVKSTRSHPEANGRVGASTPIRHHDVPMKKRGRSLGHNLRRKPPWALKGGVWCVRVRQRK